MLPIRGGLNNALTFTPRLRISLYSISTASGWMVGSPFTPGCKQFAVASVLDGGYSHTAPNEAFPWPFRPWYGVQGAGHQIQDCTTDRRSVSQDLFTGYEFRIRPSKVVSVV